VTIISDEHAYFMIKQHKRTNVGRQAAAWFEKKFDSDYYSYLDQLRLIEAYIDGFGDGYKDARRVTLEAELNRLDYGEDNPGTHPANKLTPPSE
jgi:hypothetical protein